MCPGDRHRRWKQSCGLMALIECGIGILFWVGGGPALALIPFVLAALSIREYVRGWELDYTIPAKAWLDAQKPGVAGEVARKAITRVQIEADDPNRIRYAFDKRRGIDWSKCGRKKEPFRVRLAKRKALNAIREDNKQ